MPQGDMLFGNKNQLQKYYFGKEECCHVFVHKGCFQPLLCLFIVT